MTTTADPAAATEPISARLASRLPAEGPVLALGALAGEHTPPRRDLDRRSLGTGSSIAEVMIEPGSWGAIVVAHDPRILDWPAAFTLLRGALREQGRLFVIVPAGGAAASAAAASEVVAGLYESAFCVLHEEDVVVASSGGGVYHPLRSQLPGAEDGASSGGGVYHPLRSQLPGAEDGAGAGGAAATPAPTQALLIEARPDDHLVRSYREGDEAAILRLFEASFSPARGHDHWRWKYRDNPFGTLAISCAYAPGGELVAHYAAYPVRFRRSHRRVGETLLCHQVGDTMTDRRYRHVGRGRTSLLSRTARHFYARRCEGRVAFNYGFNTGNIQRFSQLFVGARKVWDIELRRCRVADFRLTPPRRFRRYRASRVERLDAAFDDLFEHVAPDHGLLVERRRAYLEWRYLRCPDRDYHLIRVDQGSLLAGWGVFRADGDRLLWGDALFDPDHPGAVSALLRHASGIAPSDAGGKALEASASPAAPAGGERRVEGWFARHPPWWNEQLAELGFVAAPEPQDLGMVFVPFLECPDDELATGYYLTMGDSDLF